MALFPWQPAILLSKLLRQNLKICEHFVFLFIHKNKCWQFFRVLQWPINSLFEETDPDFYGESLKIRSFLNVAKGKWSHVLPSVTLRPFAPVIVLEAEASGRRWDAAGVRRPWWLQSLDSTVGPTSRTGLKDSPEQRRVTALFRTNL